MPDNIDELKKLELLNEARRELNAEYNKKKSDEYNNWLLKNSNAIKSTNLHSPLPPFMAGNTIPYYVASVPMPTEHEVVARAVSLYNTRYSITPVPETVPVVPDQQEPKAEIQSITEENNLAEIQPITEEPNIETSIEPETLENDELAGLQLRDAMIQEIYKIYGDRDIKDLQPPILPKETTTTLLIEEALSVVPQPAEELSKIKNSNNSFASIYQKFQSMKNVLTNPTDKGSP